MKVKLNVQQSGVNTLKERFERNSNKDLKKVYMVIGNIKESGFDIIEEFLIDLKARKYFLIGIDKKNTTRRMLEELLKYTKNVYIYNNNYENELDASIYVFEYANVATVYIASGSVSESSFVTDYACYTEIVYNLEDAQDKEQYKEFIDGIVKQSKTEEFINIDKAYVAKLVEDKEIFSTKQYTHNVMSIAELMKKNEDKKQEEGKPQGVVPKIDVSTFSDITFDIDLGEEKVIELKEEIKDDVSKDMEFEDLQEKDVEAAAIEEMTSESVLEEDEEYEISNEVIDMESMLFEKANVAVGKSKKSKQVDKKEDGIKSKKVDLTKVSNLFIELPAKVAKGKDVSQIKVPNYIKDMIQDFFECLENTKINKNEDGLNEKKCNIDMEIIDVNSNTKYKDSEAYMLDQQGKTYISFVSNNIKDIYYEEGDIARIIKLSTNSYHIEIIPKSCEEYNVWKKLCTKNLRGSARSYGVM